MATDWYLMGASPVYNSGYEKDEFDMFAKDSFNEILATSPVSDGVQIINNDLTLISEINSVVMNNVADSTTKSVERYIMTTIGTLSTGDYIKYENKIWLITSLIGNNKIYEKGIMRLCNYTLKFQSSDGTILSYPCIDSTNNTAGVDENKVITTGNTLHTIKLPFDSNTVLINTDDRFIIDDPSVEIPQVFAVSKPNRTEFKYGDKGLIELTMKQDKFQDVDGDKPKDRQDLGVCNYFEPSTTPIPPDNELYAELKIDGSLILGGNPRTITSIFYESDGVVNNDVIVVWNIEHEERFNITYGQNTCTIQVKDEEDYDLLDYSPILVSVSDGNGGYEGSIPIEIGTGW